MSLPDDLSPLLSCGRSSAYRISEEGFSSARSFKSEKNFLPRVWIRGIARTCAEAGLFKRNSYGASDHFKYWPRADLRTFQAVSYWTRTGGKEGSHPGDHQGSTGG